MILNKEEDFDEDKLKCKEKSSIFRFIDPNGNDKLSEMSGTDLQELIVLIDEYYLELRTLLGFEEYITFGLELEFEHLKFGSEKRLLSEMRLKEGWKIINDRSLINGKEIVSPILRDNYYTWRDLTSVCAIISSKAKIGNRSGGHIHVGTQVLGNDRQSWLNFLKIWSVYENVIFRFSYGDFLTARPTMLKFSEPMTKDFWRYYENLSKENASLEAIIKKISYENLYYCRYKAVNFTNVKSEQSLVDLTTGNTIEFRCPNGSLNPAIWQNNVNLFVTLLNYSRSIDFNDDLVEQRHLLNLDRFSKLEYYDEIYLEQVLEFCDMIFTNNFDKICFLRQYLKSYDVCKKSSKYPKARALTRK